MVKLIVLYGKPEDPSAFDAYYASTHAPLAEKIPNLKRYEHGKALGSADGSEAPYYYVADLSFDDADALQAGMSSPEGAAAGADVANFASGGATMFIAQA
jgi:uncharacterized protein (TIGR02118 family)